MKKQLRKERAAQPALSFADRTKRFRDGEQLEVRIEKLVWGGAGLARTERGVVFVDFAAPGDLLKIQVTHVEKDYARAKVLTVVEASGDRIPSPCPVFGRCGGCDWQHLSIERQLDFKIELLAEALKRHVNYEASIERIPSPKAWNYRNRIQIHLDEEGPYYHAKRSHQPVRVRECPIAEDAINEQLRTIAPLKKSTEPQRLQLSSTQEPLQDIEAPLSFEFAQVNTLQNQQLVDHVLNWAGEVSFERFFDLYSGSGNFSFPLSEKFPLARGTAVELNPKSVRSAQTEVLRRKWSRQRLEFFAGSVDALMPRLPMAEKSLILLDPPRAGLAKSVSEILAHTEGAAILYVSCDPPGLMRDLKRIVQHSRWEIHRIAAFDMFPQTAHLEVLTELRPKGFG